LSPLLTVKHLRPDFFLRIRLWAAEYQQVRAVVTSSVRDVRGRSWPKSRFSAWNPSGVADIRAPTERPRPAQRAGRTAECLGRLRCLHNLFPLSPWRNGLRLAQQACRSGDPSYRQCAPEPASSGGLARHSARCCVNVLSEPADVTYQPERAVPVVRLLGDAENHHRRGVHDADDDPIEPDDRIGEVSPIIGTAPERPVVYTFPNGPRVLRVDP
jgi:hypothetical protein